MVSGHYCIEINSNIYVMENSTGSPGGLVDIPFGGENMSDFYEMGMMDIPFIGCKEGICNI